MNKLIIAFIIFLFVSGCMVKGLSEIEPRSYDPKLQQNQNQYYGGIRKK